MYTLKLYTVITSSAIINRPRTVWQNLETLCKQTISQKAVT